MSSSRCPKGYSSPWAFKRCSKSYWPTRRCRSAMKTCWSSPLSSPTKSGKFRPNWESHWRSITSATHNKNAGNCSSNLRRCPSSDRSSRKNEAERLFASEAMRKACIIGIWSIEQPKRHQKDWQGRQAFDLQPPCSLAKECKVLLQSQDSAHD